MVMQEQVGMKLVVWSIVINMLWAPFTSTNNALRKFSKYMSLIFAQSWMPLLIGMVLDGADGIKCPAGLQQLHSTKNICRKSHVVSHLRA